MQFFLSSYSSFSMDLRIYIRTETHDINIGIASV